MKVGELVKILEDEDANADILIAESGNTWDSVLVILKDGESVKEINLGGA